MKHLLQYLHLTAEKGELTVQLYSDQLPPSLLFVIVLHFKIS